MAKFYGKIGYAELVETAPGVWSEDIVEHEHYGELTRHTSKLVTSQQVNDNMDVNTEISIMADTYAVQNFQSMRYVEFMGNKWKITSVAPQYPRLILSIGGLYNV